MANQNSSNPITQSIDSPNMEASLSFFEEMSSAEPVDESVDSALTEGDGDGIQKNEGTESESQGESPEKEGEEEQVTEVKTEATKEATPPVVTSKMLAASKGDSKFEIPEDAVFKFKVDGKEVEVTAADLQKNYQAKIPWERHYAETKAEAKRVAELEATVSAEKADLQTKWDDILTTFETNPYLAFEKIAELKGKNPADYLPIYIAQSKKTLEELAKLSDAQYQALLISKKNTHVEKQLNKQKEDLEKSKVTLEREREIKEADDYFIQKATEFKFTKEEVDMAVAVAQSVDKNTGKPIVDFTKLKPKDASDLIINYINTIERPAVLVEAAIKEVDPNLLENKALVHEIQSLIKPHFTKDFVVSIIKGYLTDSTPNPESKTQAQSGAESKGAATASKPNAGTVIPKRTEPRVGVNGDGDAGLYMSMDDILAEYATEE